MMRPEPILSAVAGLAGLGLALRGMPTVDDALAARDAELSRTLASRAVHLDPAEVNTLLHDVQSRVQLVDVRPEADFNLFHLVDARRLTSSDLRRSDVRATLDPKAIKVLVGNGEADAEAAWRLLTAAGIRDAYVLEGGIGLWLDVFRDGDLSATREDDAASDAVYASFHAALGARYPFARPAKGAAEGRTFETKAKRLTKVAKPAGGCGG